jgi:hypothetical protein
VNVCVNAYVYTHMHTAMCVCVYSIHMHEQQCTMSAQRALEEKTSNRVDQRSEMCRPETPKCVDQRFTGGNYVQAAFACVKSGKGRVVPVYSREISKISQRNSRISKMESIRHGTDASMTRHQRKHLYLLFRYYR